MAKCQGRPTAVGDGREWGMGVRTARRLRLIRCRRTKKHFPSGRSDNAIKQIQQNAFIMPFGFSPFSFVVRPFLAAGNNAGKRERTATTMALAKQKQQLLLSIIAADTHGRPRRIRNFRTLPPHFVRLSSGRFLSALFCFVLFYFVCLTNCRHMFT